jgi:hypothetical protein
VLGLADQYGDRVAVGDADDAAGVGGGGI